MNKVSMLSKSAEHTSPLQLEGQACSGAEFSLRSERIAEDKLLELRGQVSGLHYHKLHTSFDTRS